MRSPVFQEQNVLGKWKETAWAKKLDAKNKRASLSDFDRFKVRVAKKERASIVAKL